MKNSRIYFVQLVVVLFTFSQKLPTLFRVNGFRREKSKKLLLIGTCITKIAFSHSETSVQELFSTRRLCLTKADSVLSAHSVFNKYFLFFKH